MDLFRAVIDVLAPSKVPGLAMVASDDGVIVQFIGCRSLGDLITEKFKARREHALHTLLVNKFRVRAAMAPTTADMFHLLVVGVVCSECT